MAMHHNGNPTMWNYKFFIPLFKLDAHSCTTKFDVPLNKLQYIHQKHIIHHLSKLGIIVPRTQIDLFGTTL